MNESTTKRPVSTIQELRDNWEKADARGRYLQLLDLAFGDILTLRDVAGTVTLAAEIRQGIQSGFIDVPDEDTRTRNQEEARIDLEPLEIERARDDPQRKSSVYDFYGRCPECNEVGKVSSWLSHDGWCVVYTCTSCSEHHSTAGVRRPFPISIETVWDEAKNTAEWFYFFCWGRHGKKPPHGGALYEDSMKVGVLPKSRSRAQYMGPYKFYGRCPRCNAVAKVIAQRRSNGLWYILCSCSEGSDCGAYSTSGGVTNTEYTEDTPEREQAERMAAWYYTAWWGGSDNDVPSGSLWTRYGKEKFLMLHEDPNEVEVIKPDLNDPFAALAAVQCSLKAKDKALALWRLWASLVPGAPDTNDDNKLRKNIEEQFFELRESARDERDFSEPAWISYRECGERHPDDPECVHCNGTGQNGNGEDCQHCQGSGEKLQGSSRLDCPTCGGDGIVFDSGEDCLTCCCARASGIRDENAVLRCEFCNEALSAQKQMQIHDQSHPVGAWRAVSEDLEEPNGDCDHPTLQRDADGTLTCRICNKALERA
jgi:transcription elongation factor Elf1